jgi:hypothetical protein
VKKMRRQEYGNQGSEDGGRGGREQRSGIGEKMEDRFDRKRDGNKTRRLEVEKIRMSSLTGLGKRLIYSI